jgi:hypothetical protein
MVNLQSQILEFADKKTSCNEVHMHTIKDGLLPETRSHYKHTQNLSKITKVTTEYWRSREGHSNLVYFVADDVAFGSIL